MTHHDPWKGKAKAVRKEALKVLREGRELSRAGRIREGRTSTHNMALDIVEDVRFHRLGEGGGIEYYPPAPEAIARATAYLVGCLPRPADPGSRHARRWKIAAWNNLQYVQQQHVIHLYEWAVECCVADLRGQDKPEAPWLRQYRVRAQQHRDAIRAEMRTEASHG